jgi:glucose/arabinose dehydrogenase
MRRALPLLTLAALPGLACAQVEQGPPNAPYAPAWATQTRAPELPATAVAATEWSGPLDNAWGIGALPDGTFVVSERPNGLRLVQADGTVGELIAGVPEADTREQGGYLDVAVSPGFATDRTIVWTYAKPMGEGRVATAAASGVLSEDGTTLTDVRDVFVQDPPSLDPMHYGSRAVFDGEGHLFVTTGEHYNLDERWRAQDVTTTWGKVVRVGADGSAPADNPFAGGEGAAPEVWTLGHRNLQGAALDGEGRLWTIEHGPLGGDELNLSKPGANYGWAEVSYGLNYEGTPVGTGEPRAEGIEEPAYYWDPVIAPGGMDFYSGSLFEGWQGDLLIGSLNPGGLVRVRLGDDDRVEGEERMLPDVGRVRDVEELPDGSLLLLIDAPQAPILRVTPG